MPRSAAVVAAADRVCHAHAHARNINNNNNNIVAVWRRSIVVAVAVEQLLYIVELNSRAPTRPPTAATSHNIAMYYDAKCLCVRASPLL